MLPTAGEVGRGVIVEDLSDIAESCPPEVQRFDALEGISGVRHSLLLKAPRIDVSLDRQDAIANLRPYYRGGISCLGYTFEQTATAEQVHGSNIARVDCVQGFDFPVAGVDGLVTDRPGILLGILVADCCAVYMTDRQGRAIALVHSGRKGAQLGIVSAAIREMIKLGIEAENLVVQLSPCIRPPAYEEDFAAIIRRDCMRAGIPADQIHDEGICTSSNPGRYYSYRGEGGKTGRMLALLGLSHIPEV
ncbi:MAG: polyphenol oxidase family protein [Verrucomicrobiales bacterium]